MKRIIIMIAIIYLFIGLYIAYASYRIATQRDPNYKVNLKNHKIRTILKILIIILFYSFLICKIKLDKFIDNNYL